MIETLDELARLVRARASRDQRLIVAIAGPPGAGKSTLAEALLEALNRDVPGTAGLVPMDGYHFDNAVIEPLGLLARKGSPETFDAAGLISALRRIRSGGEDVAVPVFDRSADLSRAGARIIARDQRVVLVEGNYLLLDSPPWDELAPLFDLTIFVEVNEAELERRRLQRWRQHGWKPERARRHVEHNDMPNGRLVVGRSRAADLVIGTIDLAR